MKADEILNKIKAAMGFQEEEFKKKKEEPTVDTPADTPTDQPTETPAEQPTETPVDDGKSLEEQEAERRAEYEDLKKKEEERNKQVDEMQQKLSEQTQELITQRSAMKDLISLVEYLSQQPTDTPTEEKKNGIKNHLSDQRMASLEKFKECFKQAKEKLK